MEGGFGRKALAQVTNGDLSAHRTVKAELEETALDLVVHAGNAQMPSSRRIVELVEDSGLKVHRSAPSEHHRDGNSACIHRAE